MTGGTVAGNARFRAVIPGPCGRAAPVRIRKAPVIVILARLDRRPGITIHGRGRLSSQPLDWEACMFSRGVLLSLVLALAPGAALAQEVQKKQGLADNEAEVLFAN